MSPVAHALHYDQHSVQTPDVRLHYAEVASSGPPMVLLHGIGMDWRVWQGISRRLAPHYHLYLVDLRGHGESEKPARGYTLAHYAADVEDFLDALGLRGVTLVGSSLGGMVAAVVEAPTDLVSYRVLVDPPITGGPVRDVRMFDSILDLKHRPVRELAGFLGRSNPGVGTMFLNAMSEMWHEAADGVIEDMLAEPRTYFDIDAALRADPAPTLVMGADPARGGVLTDAGAGRALSLLPKGDFVRVAGAGHAIHAYQPVEFVRLIREFTTRTAR